MSQSIFRTVPLVKKSFLQQALKQQPEENAVIELNNLLASTPIRDISPKAVGEIEEKYALNLKLEFRLNLEEFYATYLNYCLADRVLNDEELADLKHLKTILALDDSVIDNLHARIGSIVYKKSFEEAVSDGRLTSEEQAFLNKLETDLRLPKQLAEKISLETRTAYVQNYVTKIMADQQLSPDEEEELKAITSSLNIDPGLSDKTKQQLEKFKLYWALKNLPLPVFQPDMAIQKDEACHFMIGNVKWYELRKVRHKGYSDDELTLIDKGTIYLTNKRIIFNGSKKTSTIQLTKILKTTPNDAGVKLGKDSGKDVTLHLPDRADIFCMMLERLLRERL
jgi:hypothetical protein